MQSLTDEEKQHRTTARPAQILLVEDSPSQAAAYMSYLVRGPYEVQHVASGEAALRYLDQMDPAAILLDLGLPDISGLDLLMRIRQREIFCPVVIITDQATLDNTVEAMRSGASDFLTKPISADRLRITLENQLRQHELSKLVRSYRETFDQKCFHAFIGKSFAMQAVYQMISSIAASDASIFITGESGTGKELCAEAVHLESKRSEGPIIALNCAAIPAELAESEIFGHVKGAFTGAHSTRQGIAGRAHGGTLFFDEICEMPLPLQVKLLRFIQTGTYLPVGGTELITVDVRFICATNRDPVEEVRAGRFREDLYYRLHVLPIHMPSLREREGDIGLMAQTFLERYAEEENKRFYRFAAAAEDAIVCYAWPGNVRELQNVIRNVVVLNDGETVTLDMLPAKIRQPGNIALSDAAAETLRGPTSAVEDFDATILPMREVERTHIERAIENCNGNVPHAATILGMSPSTVYRKLRQWRDNEPVTA